MYERQRNMPKKPPVPNIQRAGTYGDLDWDFPDRGWGFGKDVPGPAVCSRCHAYLETDHWKYDERRYSELKKQPDVHQMLCPGCTRIERRIYEGEIIIRHDWNGVDKAQVLNLIHNEEARERITNPSARIALLEDRGEEIYILTTTQFLARRIGTELEKAYRGSLKVMPLRQERFTRVRWTL